MSGAWGCFDEFNRLSTDQLSMISDQIRGIQLALRNKAQTVNLIGKEITMNLNSAIFITLNPAGAEYKGRSHLPESLKALFRPICMGKPDILKIAEVLLLTEGFAEYSSHARKLLILFESFQYNLCSQRHYIWGLRTLKAIIQTAGKIRRNLCSEDKKSSNIEEEIVSRAIQTNCLPSLRSDDIKYFLRTLLVTFSSNGILPDDSSTLRESVMIVLNSSYMSINSDMLMSKVLQLKMLLDQRIGCAIVGDSFCGKSTIWKLLKSALILNKEQDISTLVLNPKAVSRKQLLGYLDCDTNEWFDGLLVQGIRKAINEKSGKHFWIICDGDIEPEWIEDLNSILDDNRLLTLPNGERIILPSSLNFIFETNCLLHASPATISRLGVMLISESVLSMEGIVSHFIQRSEDQKIHHHLKVWMDRYLFRAFKILDDSKFKLMTSRAKLGKCLLGHLSYCHREEDFVVKLFEIFDYHIISSMRQNFREALVGMIKNKEIFNRIDKTKFNSLGSSNHGKNVANIRSFINLMDPFLIIGTSGSGKETTLRKCAQACGCSCRVITISCSKGSSSFDIIHHIEANCVFARTRECLIAKPRDVGNLILLIKDVDLPAYDEYGSNSISSLLHYIISHGGYHNVDLDFVKVEKVNIVLTCSNVVRCDLYDRLQGTLGIMRIGEICHDDLKELCALRMQPFAIHFDCEMLSNFVIDLFTALNSKNMFNFTLAHLSTWIEGLSRYDLLSNHFIDCISHEAHYQFQNILSKENGLHIFDATFDDILKKYWPKKQRGQDIYSFHSEPHSTKEVLPSSIGQLQLVSHDTVKSYYDRQLTSYNNLNANIMLPESSIHLLNQIEHALTNKNGHCILIGKRGAGRRVFSKFVSFCHGLEWAEARFDCANHEKKVFHNDLKDLLRRTGIDDIPVCVYIREYIASHPVILQSINSVISYGYDPSLFSSIEDLDLFVSALIEKGRTSKMKPINIFSSRVRKNLHFCLSLDSSSDIRNEISRFYPSICQQMTLISIPDPNMKTLIETYESYHHIDNSASDELIASIFFDNHDDECNKAEDIFSEHFITNIVNIHLDASVRLNALPVDFFTLLTIWTDLYQTKKKTYIDDLVKVENGTKKVREAQGLVNKLREDSISQETFLRLSQKDADSAMEAITMALSQAKTSEQASKRLLAELDEKKDEVFIRKLNIKQHLDDVNPLLQKARESIGNISNAHLHEMRSLKSPPKIISDVLGAVLLLLGQKVSCEYRCNLNG